MSVELNWRAVVAAVVVVGTLLIVGLAASLLQDDPVESRRLDAEVVEVCTPPAPLPTQFQPFTQPTECELLTPTPTPDGG